MSRQQTTSQKDNSQAIASTMVDQLQTRPFAAESHNEQSLETAQLHLQAKPEHSSSCGHHLANINLTAPVPPVQAKLTIGQPNDKYEQEADRVANQVVQKLSAPSAVSSSGSKPEESTEHKSGGRTLRLKPMGQSASFNLDPGSVLSDNPLQVRLKPIIQRLQEQAATADLDASIHQARGGGQSLGAVQASMENAFGADFSSVRIHHNSESDRLSRSIQARAFTTGQDIFFRKGEYDPNSRSGQHLLAHELTHVVQQNGAAVQRKPSQFITESAPQISRSPAGTIQCLPMSMADFDAKIKKHWPLKGNTLSNLRKKLEHFHTNLRFLTLDDQIAQLEHMREVAEWWINDNYDFKNSQHNHPKTTAGLEELIQSVKVEILSLEDIKQQNQGASNQISSNVNGEVQTIYQQKIYTPILKAIESKLSLHRGGFRRSKELNAFRQKLKVAARGQAYLDIDAVAKTVMQDESKEESEAFQEYYATKAKIEAYSGSKTFVNEALEELAKEITDEAVPLEETCDVLTQVAVQAASGYKDPTEAMVAKAEAIVKEQIGKTKGANAGKAIEKARAFKKGEKANRVDELEKDIQHKVSDNDQQFAKTTLKKVIESDTLDKGFLRLGKLVDLAVPSPGSSCEVDIQIKVPISHGGYFITRVVGSAEKDSEDGKQEVETKLDVSLGGGWECLGVVDFNLQLGLFFKSKAETSQKALQQVSYGFYRRLQNENKNGTVANAVWGMKGANKVKNNQGQAMTSGESAEIWAAAMEELLFYERGSDGKVMVDPTTGKKKRNEASVEVGWLIGAQGKGTSPLATAEGELKYKRGMRYSAESLGDGLGKYNKTLDQLKQANAGQARNTLVLKSEVDVKSIGSGFGCGLEGSLSWNSTGIYEYEVEAFGKANTQWGEDKEAWQTALASIGASAGDLIKKLVDKARAKDAILDSHGALANIGFTTTDLAKFSDSGKTLGAQLADSTPKIKDGVTGEEGKALGAKQSFKLAVKYSGERTNITDPFEQALEVSVSRLREMGYEAELGGVGVKAKAETGEKLVRVKFGWGSERKFAGNFLGLGNLGNKGK